MGKLVIAQNESLPWPSSYRFKMVFKASFLLHDPSDFFRNASFLYNWDFGDRYVRVPWAPGPGPRAGPAVPTGACPIRLHPLPPVHRTLPLSPARWQAWVRGDPWGVSGDLVEGVTGAPNSPVRKAEVGRVFLHVASEGPVPASFPRPPPLQTSQAAGAGGEGAQAAHGRPEFMQKGVLSGRPSPTGVPPSP